MRTVVYVAHKLSAPTRQSMLNNGRTAALWCSWLCRHFDVATVADWIVMSSVLEETPENRRVGLDCDFALVARCDVFIHVGLGISEGMLAEQRVAEDNDLEVVDLTALGEAVPLEDRWFVEAVAKILEPFGIERAKEAA